MGLIGMGYRSDFEAGASVLGIDGPTPTGRSGVLAAYAEDLISGGALDRAESELDEDPNADEKRTAIQSMRAAAESMMGRTDGIGAHRPSRARSTGRAARSSSTTAPPPTGSTRASTTAANARSRYRSH